MPEHTGAVTFAPDRESTPRALYYTPKWYACSTRSRHEKQVGHLFGRRGIESFLPLVSQVSQWKDRKKTVLWPLFPGYIFCRFALKDLSQVLTTRGVAAVIGIRGHPEPIAAAEIESVRLCARAASAADIVLVPAPLVSEGRRVRISAGPFLGVEGIVLEHRGRGRVLVGIAAIRQGVEVDVPLADLLPILEAA